MSKRSVTILAGALLLALCVCGSALVRGKGKQPTATDGTYDVTVRGYYSGAGTIGIVAKTIIINGSVKVSDSGSEVVLSAPALPLNGDHFEGNGTVGGLTVHIEGRLDGYDGDKNFQGARVLATYRDSANHRGRIAGVLTGPPPAPPPGTTDSGSGGSGSTGTGSSGTGSGSSGSGSTGAGSTGSGSSGGSSTGSGGTGSTGTGGTGTGSTGGGPGGSTNPPPPKPDDDKSKSNDDDGKPKGNNKDGDKHDGDSNPNNDGKKTSSARTPAPARSLRTNRR